MKILLTGGTGVIGASAVRELHAGGHKVRVLTRHAERDRIWWPDGVDAWTGDVSDEESIRGSATDCDAVIHIAGIIKEDAPSATFQSVNIEGTRFVTMEAERAGISKLIYVSSLGADRGGSAYHRSKSVAEEVVRTFSRDWLVVRPGAVYGPGDDHISVLLRMVQTLPVVPTIGGGDQPFQPIWHEDFARVLRAAVERDDVRNQQLDVSGTELTCQNDLINRLRKITGRDTVTAPIPDFVADWGLRALNVVWDRSAGQRSAARDARGGQHHPSRMSECADECVRADRNATRRGTTPTRERATSTVAVRGRWCVDDEEVLGRHREQCSTTPSRCSSKCGCISPS